MCEEHAFLVKSGMRFLDMIFEMTVSLVTDWRSLTAKP